MKLHDGLIQQLVRNLAEDGWPRVGVVPTLGLFWATAGIVTEFEGSTIYSGRMPAGLVRLQQTGHSHFITFTCYRRMEHLTNRHACSVVLRALENTRRRHGLRVFGFVPMPEHVPILLSEPENGTLARALQSLKSASARMARGARTETMETRTPFWQARYYDRYRRDFEEFSEKLRYIHRIPVKRGLCSSPEHWPWSSFQHYWNGADVVVEIESERTARARPFQGR